MPLPFNKFTTWPIANVSELTIMALLIPSFAIALKRSPLKINSSRNPTNSMVKNPVHIESVSPLSGNPWKSRSTTTNASGRQ